MSDSGVKSIKFSESQDYELIETVEADGGIPVSYYINKITGLKIFLAYAERPIVKGNLSFATEAHDDDGLPHTLEHLVFMGSEKYPYKGVLDLLANLSFSPGTNALTDVDYTTYTMTTAGAEGFLNLLPIYMEHLFFPTLTEHSYVTEIHHINGRGEDAGVVYCEMQARENSGDERCDTEMRRAMYPGRCGYKSCTGGLISNIRSLNNDKIKQYHAKYYVPKNFCMIITGPVTPEALFESIKPVEDKLVERFANLPEMEKPWSSEVPPLEKSVTKTIQYPCDTDEDGLVYLGYRGPDASDFEECVAITLLTEYLNQPSISPFQKEFVEADKPFCSSIDVGMVENTKSYFYFSFESVVVELIPTVVDKVHQILNKLVSGEEEFDTERMNLIISRRKVRLLLSCEQNPHRFIIDAATSHFLYGNRNMKDKFQVNRILDKFTSVDKYYWLGLITKFMIGPEARYVCINGEPSSKLLESMLKDEEIRIEDQKKLLAQELARKEEILLEAKKYNDRPVPDEILSDFPYPSIDNIKFFEIETKSHDDHELPITVRYDVIDTSFISIYVAMNTSHSLEPNDRLYLPMLEQLLLESPIIRDGKLIPHQDVVRELFADTISVDISTGIPGLSNIFLVHLQVEVENYAKAVTWISDILSNTQFPAERIRTISKRMIGDISQIKREGEQVVAAASSFTLYKENSNNSAGNFIRQQTFLKDILKKLKSDPKSVEDEFIRIRNLLTKQPNNIYAHLSINKKVAHRQYYLFKPWKAFLPEQQEMNKNLEWDEKRFLPFNIVKNHQLINWFPDEGIDGVAIPIGSTESSYLHHIMPSINDPYHRKLASLMVMIQYLTQLEGPLWRQLRGEGFTYHYFIRLSVHSGLLSLGMERSTQLVDAYEKTHDLLLDIIDSNKLDKHLLRSAQSGLIYEFAAREKNPASKSLQSFRGFLLNIDSNYDRNMLAQISQVQIPQLRVVLGRYIQPFFRPGRGILSVCCNPTKLDDIISRLNSKGCYVTPYTLESISTYEHRQPPRPVKSPIYKFDIFKDPDSDKE